MTTWLDYAVQGYDPPNTHDLPPELTEQLTFDLVEKSFDIKLVEIYRIIHPLVLTHGPIRPDDQNFLNQRHEKEHRVSLVKDIYYEAMGLAKFWDPPDMILFYAVQHYRSTSPEFKARVEATDTRQNQLIAKIYSGTLDPDEELLIMMSMSQQDTEFEPAIQKLAAK
jgi:hypothetical protein